MVAVHILNMGHSSFSILPMCPCTCDLQAADIVRIIGIGRNEYIAIMVQVRPGRTSGPGGTWHCHAGPVAITPKQWYAHSAPALHLACLLCTSAPACLLLASSHCFPCSWSAGQEQEADVAHEPGHRQGPAAAVTPEHPDRQACTAACTKPSSSCCCPPGNSIHEGPSVKLYCCLLSL